MVIARWNYWIGFKSLRFSIPLMYSLFIIVAPKSIWVDTRKNPNLNSFFSFCFLEKRPNLNSRSTKDDLRDSKLPHMPQAHVAQPTHKSALESWAQYITLMDEAQGSRLRKEKIWPQKSAPISEALKIFNQMGQIGTHNFGHPTSSRPLSIPPWWYWTSIDPLKPFNCLHPRFQSFVLSLTKENKVRAYT